MIDLIVVSNAVNLQDDSKTVSFEDPGAAESFLMLLASTVAIETPATSELMVADDFETAIVEDAPSEEDDEPQVDTHSVIEWFNLQDGNSIPSASLEVDSETVMESQALPQSLNTKSGLWDATIAEADSSAEPDTEEEDSQKLQQRDFQALAPKDTSQQQEYHFPIKRQISESISNRELFLADAALDTPDAGVERIMSPVSINPLSNAPASGVSVFHSMAMPQSVQHKDWSDGFGQHILWLGQQKIKSAVLRLNPENMGPLEVSLKMQKDGVQLHVSTQNAQIQDLIEQSLPTLREMLQQQGLELGQTNIEQRQLQSGQQQGKDQSAHVSDSDLTAQREDGESAGNDTVLRTTQGIIDYFA